MLAVDLRQVRQTGRCKVRTLAGPKHGRLGRTDGLQLRGCIVAALFEGGYVAIIQVVHSPRGGHDRPVAGTAAEIASQSVIDLAARRAGYVRMVERTRRP